MKIIMNVRLKAVEILEKEDGNILKIKLITLK
jgi:hypothetical protein